MKNPDKQQVQVILNIEGDPFGGPANRALDDVGEHWWSGVFKAGVYVAMASALAVGHQTQVAASTVALQQDDPAGKLHGQPDEDFPARLVQISPTIVRYLQPWGFGDSGTRLAGAYDDTHLLWDNPNKPLVRPFKPFEQRLGEQDEQATGLHGPDPDGDTRVSLLSLSDRVSRYPQPWSFDSGSVQLSERDEGDGWWNQVKPIPFSLIWPQPYSFEQNDIAFGIPDADEIHVSLLHVDGRNARPEPFGFDSGNAQLSERDEDYWQNWVVPKPWVLTYPQQWTFEQHEIFIPVCDSDEIHVTTLRLDGRNARPEPWSFDSGAASITPAEEDYWQNPKQLVEQKFRPLQPFFDDQDLSFSALDEDFPARVLSLGPRIERFPLPGAVDSQAWIKTIEEDYWQNPLCVLIRPINGLWQVFFDEQTPSLYGTPDQDDLHVHLLSLNPFNVRPEPFSFDSGNVRLVSSGVIDEDIWTDWSTIARGCAQIELTQRRLAIRSLTDQTNEQIEPKPGQRRMYVTRMIEVLNLDSFPERG